MKNLFILIIAMVIVGLLISGYLFFTREKPADSYNGKPTAGGAYTLSLNNQKLEKIPAYVFSQTNLIELDVANNRLTGAIQAEIRQLKNLRTLKAANNLMTGVPAEIGQLKNLEVLDLSNNRLTGLPYEIGNLKNLKIFNISGNNYSEADLNIIRQNLPGGVNIIK